MKIIKVSLRDFRGFAGPEDYSFDLTGGKNLLLYGENGSGKSSLYEALRGLFELRQPATFQGELANVFTEVEDGYVSVDLSGANPPEYRWDYEEPAPGEAAGQQFIDIAQRAVFLDYRALLKTHYVHREAGNINIFDLLVDSLLSDVNFGDGKALSLHWKELQDVREEHPEDDPPPRGWDPFASIRSAAQNFRNQFDALLHTATEHQLSLEAETNRLLGTLAPGLTITLHVGEHLTPPDGNFDYWHRFDGRSVQLRARYCGYEPEHPAQFLNEARLTAIALALSLAAARLNRPPAQNGNTLRLLVLDDVLIGLDLAHRLPLLKLLARDFADWQTFVFTHDFTWFEMARQQVDGSRWMVSELFCERRTGEAYERPVLRQGGVEGFLQRARAHLESGERRAAAVYARAAFEEKFRSFCNDKSVPISFKANPSQVDGEEFFNATEKRFKSQGQWSRIGSQFQQLRMLRKVVLNPLSHSNLVNLVTPEVFEAIEAVEGLKLATVDGHPGHPACRQLLAEALKVAIQGAAFRLGVPIDEVEHDDIATALAIIEKLDLNPDKLTPALEMARILIGGEETEENKVALVFALRAAFEHSLWTFVLRKRCKVPYKKDWEQISASTLWEAAKEHQILLADAARAFVTAVDSQPSHDVLFTNLSLNQIRQITWTSLRSVFTSLEAAAPEMKYSFQTRLDVLAE